jgi:hypothetical protein
MIKMSNTISNQCQYIGANGFTMSCNKPAVPGKSYCEDHVHIVYQKGSATRKRHKDIAQAEKVRLVESLMNEAIAQLEEEGFDCYGREVEL